MNGKYQVLENKIKYIQNGMNKHNSCIINTIYMLFVIFFITQVIIIP